MKSGLPGNRLCLRHPLIPYVRKIDTNFISVSLLPFDRIAAMTRERFRFEKTSAIGAHSGERNSILKARTYQGQIT